MKVEVLSYGIAGRSGDDQVFRVDFQGAHLLDIDGLVAVKFTRLEGCADVQLVDVVALEKHHFAIDAGVAIGIDSSNVLHSHPELALGASSRWSRLLSGEADLRVTSLDSVKERQGSADTANKLLEDGGRTIDASARMLLHPFAVEDTQPFLAIVVGLGVRSAGLLDSKSGEGEVTDARWRYQFGIRFQALGYNAGLPAESLADARGYIELGIARDQFWKSENMWRWYGIQQVEIPYLGSKWIRFLARMKLDRPFPDYGASEVRFSLLASISPSVFSEILGLGR